MTSIGDTYIPIDDTYTSIGDTYTSIGDIYTSIGDRYNTKNTVTPLKQSQLMLREEENVRPTILLSRWEGDLRILK